MSEQYQHSGDGVKRTGRLLIEYKEGWRVFDKNGDWDMEEWKKHWDVQTAASF